MRKELVAYGHGLDEKDEIVALNKIDAMSDDEIAEKQQALKDAGAVNIIQLSGVARTGIDDVLRRLRPFVDANRRGDIEEEEEAWSP